MTQSDFPLFIFAVEEHTQKKKGLPWKIVILRTSVAAIEMAKLQIVSIARPISARYFVSYWSPYCSLEWINPSNDCIRRRSMASFSSSSSSMLFSSSSSSFISNLFSSFVIGGGSQPGTAMVTLNREPSPGDRRTKKNSSTSPTRLFIL